VHPGGWHPEEVPTRAQERPAVSASASAPLYIRLGSEALKAAF
jgi:hypothetical protein